jgi:ATP-dependent DNA helicase RecQ
LGLEKEIPTVSPAETSDQNLTKALKAWRRNLADELNIPPYVIFGDKTLADLSKRKPHSISQLCKCYGIGQVKAERFGSAILRIINDWS